MPTPGLHPRSTTSGTMEGVEPRTWHFNKPSIWLDACPSSKVKGKARRLRYLPESNEKAVTKESREITCFIFCGSQHWLHISITWRVLPIPNTQVTCRAVKLESLRMGERSLYLFRPPHTSNYICQVQNSLICWGENCAHCRMRPHRPHGHRANKHFIMMDDCSPQSIWKSFRLKNYSLQIVWK